MSDETAGKEKLQWKLSTYSERKAVLKILLNKKNIEPYHRLTPNDPFDILIRHNPKAHTISSAQEWARCLRMVDCKYNCPLWLSQVQKATWKVGGYDPTPLENMRRHFLPKKPVRNPQNTHRDEIKRRCWPTFLDIRYKKWTQKMK